MRRKRTLRRLAILALVIAAFVVVGSALGRNTLAGSGDMPHDGPPIATSAQAAASLAQKVTAAGQRASGTGSFTLTVTDQEVTSALRLGSLLRGQTAGLQGLGGLEGLDGLGALYGLDPGALASTAEGAQLAGLLEQIQGSGVVGGRGRARFHLGLSIQEPEVRFQASGQVIVRGDAVILFWRWPVRIVVAPRAAGGEMVLEFVEGRLGRVRIPEAVFGLLGKGIARTIVLAQDLQDQAEITRIQVEAGRLTFSGRYRQ